MTIKLSQSFIMEALFVTASYHLNTDVIQAKSLYHPFLTNFYHKDRLAFQAYITESSISVPTLILKKKNIDNETLFNIAKNLESKYGKNIIISL